MKRVLCDVDGIVADFTGRLLQLYNERSGKSLTHADVDNWDYLSSIGEHEAEKACYAILAAEGGCSSIDLIEGAIEGVKRLQEVSDVYFVTSPFHGSPTWSHEREMWLEKHFGIDHKRIVFTHSKWLIKGDILIDDKPSHLIAWQSQFSEGLGLLWDHAHNRQYSSSPRIHNWDEVLALI